MEGRRCVSVEHLPPSMCMATMAIIVIEKTHSPKTPAKAP
jgi:hypothetical protein